MTFSDMIFHLTLIVCFAVARTLYVALQNTAGSLAA